MSRPVIHHIPVCPFSQRIEILLALKGMSDAVEFRVVDITKPRAPEVLALTGGEAVPLPILVDEAGRVLRESLVILRYVEERFGPPPGAVSDPMDRGIERLMIARSDAFASAGYEMVMNRDRGRAPEFLERLLRHYRWLNGFLERHGSEGDFLFDAYGLADIAYTTLMQRFWFLDYYEDFVLPAGAAYDRVRRWKAACIGHPCANQVSREEIVKLYYDYAVGAGNGALPEGRRRSSFVFDPDWPERPMPPRDKFERIASDAELGLLSGS